ncbi:hypothetical protein IP69_21230 [Bosea sp. AAP35]|uniref:hypothetical protein n=1 Tax=Bosea sp. AAP35 TaxID=1523417 RepID=UPI0006B9764C|nr:hypothetical protein [Bosea sp. AAP35]KPF62140.1 hypothetical protein IP69_21230 [Bosea sp. AAP35]
MAASLRLDRREATVMLDEVLADLRRAGILPTPLNIIAAATDRTRDDSLVQAVVIAAERRHVREVKL